MNNHTKPVKIAALGVEQRTYSTLQLFFHGHCNDDYVLVEEKSADISIIDMDGFQACRMLEEHQKHYPDQPAILISLSEKNLHDAVYVRKPIQLEALTTALSRAKAKLQQTPVSVTPQSTATNESEAIPPVLNNVVHQPDKTKLRKNQTGSKHFNQYRYSATAMSDETELELLNIKSIAKFNPYNPIQVAKFQYQYKRTLLSYFQQAYFTALEKQQNVVLNGPWRPITIFHNTKQIRVDKHYGHLYALSGTCFEPSDVSIKILDIDVKCEPDINETVLFAEHFLWKLAMRTSRGRVPVDTCFTTPIHLVRWPNFTRSLVTPHALRIAALWAKQPTSLVDTASQLAIPVQYVFLFYSAAVSLKFIEPVKNAKKVANTAEQPLKRHKYRRIFQELLERLRSN